MKSLAQLSTAKFDYPSNHGHVRTCASCGAMVPYGLLDTHRAFHADIAAWLIVLRDGKGEV